jgi:hypothetical protein
MGGLTRKRGRPQFIKGYDIILIYRWYFNGGYYSVMILIVKFNTTSAHDIKNDSSNIKIKVPLKCC